MQILVSSVTKAAWFGAGGLACLNVSFLHCEIGWIVGFALQGFLRAEGCGFRKWSLGVGPHSENNLSLEIQSNRFFHLESLSELPLQNDPSSPLCPHSD